MSIEKFFDTYENGLQETSVDDARSELVKLAGCDMSSEDYCSILIGLGGPDWVEDLFGDLLGELLDIAEQMSDTHGALAHLGLRIMFYREGFKQSPGQCKPESFDAFQASLKKAKEMLCADYLETDYFNSLIGLAACSEDCRAARLLWDLQGGLLDEMT